MQEGVHRAAAAARRKDLRRFAVDRFQGFAHGGDKRRVGGGAPRKLVRFQLNDLDVAEALRRQMGTQECHHLRRVLVRHQSEVELDETGRGQHGLAARLAVAAVKAVDVDDRHEVGARLMLGVVAQKAADLIRFPERRAGVGQRGHRFQISSAGRAHLVVKAGNRDPARRVAQTGHRRRQPPQRIVDDRTEAAVQVRVGHPAAQLQTHDPLEAQKELRRAVRRDAAELPPATVGAQLGGVLRHEVAQAGAADLFLALDDPAHLERQRAAVSGLHRPDGRQPRNEFALVVAGPAPVEPPGALGQHERRRVPQIEGAFRLHVVVVVDQQRAGSLARLGHQNGSHLAGVLAHREALGFQQPGHGVGGFRQHPALGADALEGDQSGQVTQARFHEG